MCLIGGRTFVGWGDFKKIANYNSNPPPLPATKNKARSAVERAFVFAYLIVSDFPITQPR